MWLVTNTLHIQLKHKYKSKAIYFVANGSRHKEIDKTMNDIDNKYTEYLKTPKWKAIAEQRMNIDKYECQCCGCRGTVANPLEVHHLSYTHLYHEETRIYEDLVTLCHICHKGLHKAMERVTNADGRRGWKSNPRIPSVHTFNVSGLNTEYKEIKDYE